MFKRIKEHTGFLRQVSKREDINKFKLVYDFRNSPAKLPKPRLITISPFDFCNLRCRMCDIWKNPLNDAYKQNIQRIKDFLTDTKEHFGSDIYTAFSGGEIFQDDCIFELLKTAKDLGFCVNLDTNGTLFNDSRIMKLKKIGINQINISIDGFNKETHDSIRGVKGSYEKTVSAIDKLYSNGFTPYINTVMMKQNLDEIVPLVHFVSNSKKMNGINILMIMPLNFQKAKLYYPSLYPEEFKAKAEKVLDELISLKKNTAKIANPIYQLERYKLYLSNPEKFVKKECDMRFDIVSLDSHMTLHICPYVPPISLINRKISDVWDSVEMRYRYSLKKQCRKNCMLIVNCYDSKN